ncbi:rho family-interacting cell polarization regulator 1-like isoform 4-T4 [Odontesthes bonariensis]|uniref:rho family-interacting cell polarization regulator 1-like isoform X4 n=1 Tax=Odontesthes bonariensis TaxID=219752 RepID=UPI003F582580
MYSGYGGSPSRTLSTMSLSVRPVRRLTCRAITRSQSFAGVNTQDRPYRSLSVFSTPGVSRKSSRASRMFTMSTKSNPPPKVPQPERLDEVYEALKKGLHSYLHVHQMDLDSFSRQIKESKRNSRLGFLYELDKQVKVIERYIRRLEFHLSKIEELYEAYCLQRRLRDGANKMVKAYTDSPGSKEARESLAEANKGYKEYTENMCVLESEFESQLGEFHIKMKGLAGFARLCVGDQYEIFMKYGRQRWKLRGKMELNSKQVWDSEEMVFLPLINEFISVKVTELKSLANHVVVGNVSCETKDLFAALPQMVAVDINDLGTIKLSLEVTWNPFDKDDQSSVASTVNKAPSVSKRFSTILNQTPPDTPFLREQAFYAVVVTSEITTATGSSSPQPDRDSSSSTPKFNHKGSTATEVPSIPEHLADSNRDRSSSNSEEEVDAVMSVSHNMGQYSRSLSHISESSADGHVFADRAAGECGEATSLASGISINDIEMEMPSRSPEPASPSASLSNISLRTCIMEQSTLSDAVSDQQPLGCPHDASSTVLTCFSPKTEREDPNSLLQMNTHSHLEDNRLPENRDVTYVARRVPVEEDVGADHLSSEGDDLVDSRLEDALAAVLSSLDDYRGQFPELQLLEQELRLLRVTLKGGGHSRSPSAGSLTVETALGSFDFLNTSDWEEEEEEEEKKKSDRRRRNSRPREDQTWDRPSSPPSPLTTGCPTLDCSLVVHLRNCSAQLLRLGMFGPLRCGEMYALDRLLREAHVFEILRGIIKDNPRRLTQPAEVIPQLGQYLGAVSLWQQCVGQGSVYCVSVENFLATLSAVYSSMLRERADTVFLCLAERVLDQRLPRRGSFRDGVMVTLFQLWTYLESNGNSDMETHISELAEEVWLVQKLASCDQDVIINSLRRPAECSLRREGLHAVAKLLKDPRGKVSTSASSVLRGLAAQPTLREQALVSCLELLEEDNVGTRVCGCKALACLKAKESIDQLVYLCRTDKEEVRDAAKQTLLLLGEEGKMAHRHVEMSQDSLPRLFAPGSMASTAF